jgi:hypothetical protein
MFRRSERHLQGARNAKFKTIWHYVLPEDSVLNAETCRSDICNIHEHCII